MKYTKIGTPMVLERTKKKEVKNRGKYEGRLKQLSKHRTKKSIKRLKQYIDFLYPDM
jgi:pyruvate/2-oxoacid:ferredoxin oxidoreductase beta subunit